MSKLMRDIVPPSTTIACQRACHGQTSGKLRLSAAPRDLAFTKRQHTDMCAGGAVSSLRARRRLVDDLDLFFDRRGHVDLVLVVDPDDLEVRQLVLLDDVH